MNWRLIRWIDIYVGIPLACLAVLFSKAMRLSGLRQGQVRYSRVLLIKFWGVGNVVMLLPSVAALKKKYPEARVHFLTLISNLGVSEAARIFDRVITVDTRDPVRFAVSLLKACRLLSRGYDLVVDFEQFARISALLTMLAARQKSVGFSTRGQYRSLLYTLPVAYDNSIHIVASFYSLAVAAGAKAGPVEPLPLSVRQEDALQVIAMLRNLGMEEGDTLVLFHPGTSENFSLRRWPSASFAQLADSLYDAFRVKIIFSGLAQEAHLAREAISCMKRSNCAIDLSGKLTFGQFIALIKMCDLVVSADTAPVHLASAFGTPVVGIYGPNTPHLYGPWGYGGTYYYRKLACSPCITNFNAKINTCRHPRVRGACTKMISAAEVFEGISRDYFYAGARFGLERPHRHEFALKAGQGSSAQ